MNIRVISCCEGGRGVAMKTLYVVIILTLLSGCTVMPPTDPYKQPAEWEAPLSPGSSTADRQIKIPEEELTLQLAIETALENNPEVAARNWDVTAAEARRDHASGARLPRLGVVGQYNHHMDEQRLLSARRDGEPGIFTRDVVSSDLVLSVPIFTAGRLDNEVKAAELLRQAASQRLARSREELVFSVSSVFYSILSQRYVIESLLFSRKTLEEHVKRIDALVAAKKAAKVDRMRTDVRLADIEQKLVREKNLLSVQQRILANLLGLKGSDVELLPSGELEPQEKYPVPNLDAALSSAWKSRGDYKAARSSLEAQAKKVDSARSGHWPTVSVQGKYGGRFAVGSPTGGGDEQVDAGQVGLMLEVPLFEGGQVDANIREQQAGLHAARERLRLLNLQVRLEVESALLDVQSFRERASAIRKSIVQAKESLRIEQQKYNLGKGTIVDVLEAQAALLESETTYYRVLSEYHTAIAQLRLAMASE
jgi:outer membrane protein